MTRWGKKSITKEGNVLDYATIRVGLRFVGFINYDYVAMCLQF